MFQSLIELMMINKIILCSKLKMSMLFLVCHNTNDDDDDDDEAVKYNNSNVNTRNFINVLPRLNQCTRIS